MKKTFLLALLMLFQIAHAGPDRDFSPLIEHGAATRTAIQEGVIQGSVTDELGGPLLFTQVEALRLVGDSFVPESSTFTFLDPAFELNGLSAGTYRLRFFSAGINGGDFFTEFWQDADSLETATDIVLAESEIVTGIDARLGPIPSASISGVVTDEGGSPLVGIRVFVAQASQPAEAVTGPDGRYELGPLFAGSYVIGFTDPDDVYVTEYFDDSPSIALADRIVLTEGDSVIANATLATDAVLLGSISGTVETGGNPFDLPPIVLVEALLDTPAGFQIAGTTGFIPGEGDDYLITDLPAGDYIVRFEQFDLATGASQELYFDGVNDIADATIIGLAAGENRGGINAVFEPIPSAILAGSITDEQGQPLEGIEVVVYDEQEFVADLGRTDASGNFQFVLVPGTYVVFLRDPAGVFLDEFYLDAPNIEAATPLVLGVGSSTVIDVQLDAVPGGGGFGTISGVVEAPDISPDTLFLLVEVYWQNPQGVFEQTGGVALPLGGAYTVPDVRSGINRVALSIFDFTTGQFLQQWYEDADSLDDAADVFVESGQNTPGIDFTVSVPALPTASIGGTVTAVDGSPLSGILVSLFDATGNLLYGTVTDTNGIFEFSQLEAGTYFSGFGDNNGQYLAEFYDDAPDLESATPIALANDESFAIVAVLDADPDAPLFGRLTGSLVSETPQTLTLVQIDVLQQDDTGEWVPVAGTALVTPPGEYTIANVPVGTVRVGITATDLLTGAGGSAFFDNAATLDQATDVIIVEGATTPDIDFDLDALLGSPSPQPGRDQPMRQEVHRSVR